MKLQKRQGKDTICGRLIKIQVSLCLLILCFNLRDLVFDDGLVTDFSSSLISSVAGSDLTERREGDGCYHVFLDAGANIGIHSRFLFEPLKYPKAKTAHEAFDQVFGPPSERDNRDICSFGFEPNPQHRQRHEKLRDSYQGMGWRYNPVLAGVSDADGNMTFYEDIAGQTNSAWGYSTVKRFPKAKQEIIPVIHFARWVEHHIQNRQIPNSSYATKQRPPSVVLKLDVEGMEFIVAPSLMFTGVLCKTIDAVFGEWHTSDWIPKRPGMNEYGSGEVKPFANWQEAGQHWRTLWRALKTVDPKDCKSRWLELPDNEEYLHDGMEMPEPA